MDAHRKRFFRALGVVDAVDLFCISHRLHFWTAVYQLPSTHAQIDIACMGRKLSHSLTLKNVRDAVWLPGLTELLNGMSPMEAEQVSLDHLMALCYERRFFD
ncbi:hypothetical protein ACLOJK_033190 [Asimina triloba]